MQKTMVKSEFYGKSKYSCYSHLKFLPNLTAYRSRYRHNSQGRIIYLLRLLKWKTSPDLLKRKQTSNEMVLNQKNNLSTYALKKD